jgi:hypothetical protein
VLVSGRINALIRLWPNLALVLSHSLARSGRLRVFARNQLPHTTITLHYIIGTLITTSGCIKNKHILLPGMHDD